MGSSATNLFDSPEREKVSVTVSRGISVSIVLFSAEMGRNSRNPGMLM